MRPRPRLASSALVVLALVHAWWGAKMLLASNVLNGGTQLVSAGGLLLAAVAVGHASRSSLAVGLGAAGLATAIRALAIMPGPFATVTLLLAAGLLAAAYGARRLDLAEDNAGTIALRGGGALMAIAYVAFLGLSVALGGFAPASLEFVVRALAALAFALSIDAPRLTERKAFATMPASADG